jgi:hypothetical protein
MHQLGLRLLQFRQCNHAGITATLHLLSQLVSGSASQ